MKIKFGALVVDGRGKIGGHVASKNRAGAYMRTKVTPANANTPAQALVRSILASCSIAWKGLVLSAILAWNSAVAQYTKTDIFGDIRKPSGLNLFVKLNSILLLLGEQILGLPPVPVTLAPIPPVSMALIGDTSITLNFTATPVETDQPVMVFATSGISASKSFVKSEFRYLGQLPAPAVLACDITTLYVAKYGEVPAPGIQVFVKLKRASSVTGQTGIAVVVSGIDY